MASEFRDLIDDPRETLGVEYKDWLNLKDENAARAKLARHIAAMSNFGGGFIVVGYSEDPLEPNGTNPFPEVKYSHDLISGITRKYLSPSVQCDVREVSSPIGSKHPIIIVPAHGSSPVCAKVSGPILDGKPQGISQGVYYTRKTGPESAPILTPDEWAPIIRRCALHERSALSAAIESALSIGPSVDVSNELAVWHEAAKKAYDFELRKCTAVDWLSANRLHLSYAIETGDQQRLDPSIMLEVSRVMNFEIRDRVNTGWSMFYPFSRPPIAAFLNVDIESGQGDHEFLECSLLRDEGDISADADLWRLSTDGKATLIRPHRIDFLGQSPNGWAPCKWFSPNDLARNLGELIRHAQAFCERFNTPARVSFHCEWIGLKGREIADPNARWSPRRFSPSDTRIVSKSWPASSLVDSWPEIVSDLSAPVVRAFDPNLRLGGEWVRNQAKNWRPIGSQYP